MQWSRIRHRLRHRVSKWWRRTRSRNRQVDHVLSIPKAVGRNTAEHGQKGGNK